MPAQSTLVRDCKQGGGLKPCPIIGAVNRPR